jgi:hypothetical protein
MFVKPGPRPDDPSRPLVVRGPNGRLLPETGGEVPDTQFWQRRIAHGDVIAEPATERQSEPAAEPASDVSAHPEGAGPGEAITDEGAAR